jgi:hypothetical protein
VSPIVRTFGGRLWQRLTGPPPQPELRLTASAQLCGVDTVQDTEAGLPMEIQEISAKSKLGAADNLILTGRSVRTMGLCNEGTGGFGLYHALVLDNTLLPMPRRDQQSTLASSPQRLPKEAQAHPPLLSKPRADSPGPSLAGDPVQQLPGHIGSRTQTPAPVSDTATGSGSGETREQAVFFQSVEPLNRFHQVPGQHGATLATAHLDGLSWSRIDAEMP